MAKRTKWRYTEYVIESQPGGLIGWLKLMISYLIISPLRLVNEISQKALFLGRRTLKKVSAYAIALNGSILLWACFWQYLKPNSKPFVPFSVNILSLGLTVLIYIRLRTWKDFEYELLDASEYDEEEEEALKSFDPDAIVAFEQTQAADTNFNDSINTFIKDPSELPALGILPAQYQEGEEARLLNAIAQKEDLFPIEEIAVPDLFEEPPLGDLLESNFSSLLEEVGNQLPIPLEI